MEKKTIVARVEVLPGKEQAFLQADRKSVV